MRLICGCFLVGGLPILAVVFLPVDVPAGMVQLALNAPPFLRRELTARTSRIAFINTNSCFFGFKPSGFAPRQFAAANALPNALLLLALTQKGLAREDAYRLVQRNAMPVWQGKGDFRALLKKDAEISKLLSAKDIDALFDDAHHLAHVDTIFKRVFGNV